MVLVGCLYGQRVMDFVEIRSTIVKEQGLYSYGVFNVHRRDQSLESGNPFVPLGSNVVVGLHFEGWEVR